MPIKRANREYKKGKPFKDSRKFIIVCEGKREVEYFNFFHDRYKNLIIEIIDHDNNSAPKKLTEKAVEYIENEDWDYSLDDELWFVVDTDRWGKQLYELSQLCKGNKNWFMANSNPCFEVWLYYHVKCEKIEEGNSSRMKQALNKVRPGGYNLNKFITEFPKAITCAKGLDKNMNQLISEIGITKVYLLGLKLLELIPMDNGARNI
ncbi:MAG TPA: RloB family protein [Fulvivirga sp.]|nr:RloB family protein [Fulvivirga sp.]